MALRHILLSRTMLRRLIAMSSPFGLTLVGSASSTGGTIVVPSTAKAGDIAVLWDASVRGASTAPTAVTPTNWTNFANTVSSGTVANVRAMMDYKIFDGGDPGATVTGMDDDFDRKFMRVFRPNRPISAVTLGTLNSQFTTGDPSTQTVLAAGQACPLIVVAHWATEASHNFSGDASFTPAADESVIGSARSAIAYKVFSGAPSDITVDASNGALDKFIMQSRYLQLS